MRVKLWGTRGSVTTPTPTTARFGGNTPCVEVRGADGGRLILDAGIGLHWLGVELHGNGFVTGGGAARVLLTHTHWGHIQGIPFFTPMLDPGCSFTIYGDGGHESGGLRRRLQEQMAGAYCPVPNFLEPGIGAHLDIVQLDGAPFQVGATRVTPRRLHHVPGLPCLGYRLDDADASLAYIPDVEYLEAAHREPALALAAGVDLLIHDAYFTAAEYVTRKGQGHCSDAEAVALARDAGAARLLLFHHHPDRGDEAIETVLRGHRDAGVCVEAAAEGREYVLPAV